MKHDALKTNTLAAVMIALTVALSLLVRIPIAGTNGFVTLCEVGIYTSAILFGNPVGVMVGAGSGFLIDILAGYPVWCLFSLVIHGTQGFAVAYLTPENDKSLKATIFPLIVGSAIMVVGYCLATAFLYGWPAGIASITSNLFQVGFGMVVAVLLVKSLVKFKPSLT
ncbi:hypothetical protein FD13_GL002043 [Levilactobacillus senmaizukei DSM 21775 = NBRC 103853]|uniref:ECF transporter S component n=2 Tax=Levilactobacillus TaxID=2767886 RepID=A0A0R2DED1_9LACO|nr:MULTISPECIES: ECF transporter S component [Levilactobacillus]KRN02360.1 hypothetical protein FD13_GL002043 [Levilactobacillus senmaizukei DSM 21775 = NBRC 103853]